MKMKLISNISPLIASCFFRGSIPAASAQPFSDCDIATYYSTLPSAPLTAARNDMHTLTRAKHRNVLSYTPGVWDAVIALDGDGGSNVKLIYANTFVPASPRETGSCEYWNREHLWPRSLGVGSSGKDNTDVHHLRPSDCNVNAARSNLYFGACGTATSSSCTIPAHPEAAADTEKDSATFLPPADRRGDVARAILYMDLRYDGDADDADTLDLVVSDCPEDVPNGAGMGYLSQLLQWHIEDPPDAEEIARNQAVCVNWQGNRNPFIDYPELASIYHGGPRPLLGDGLGYDCTTPSPPPGTTSPTDSPTTSPTLPPGTGLCSDDSGTCTATDQCLCFTPTAPTRNLLERNNLRGGNNRELQSSASKLIISGVLDGPLTGGLPKMLELYVLDDIADLSDYGIGSANNGGGTDGQEFTLSGSAAAGSYITIGSEATGFATYFGESPTFVASGAMGVNGDDAVELFFNGVVADTFGIPSVDGTGQAWEYTDGWAYRNAGSSPVGSAFDISEWTLSGANAIDGCTSNSGCGSTFPFKTFVSGLTFSPSSSPTSQPTQSPTPCECVGASSTAPTNSPSKTPSASPSKTPTSSPSKNPTSSPTKSPMTAIPTSSPSKRPTSSPSQSPTKKPTLSPTDAPTKKPTSSPITSSPTTHPVPGVTDPPTSSPSKEPTSSPTKKPTDSPAKGPTDSPTQKPSESPTKEPSSSPSEAPTKKPSESPTKEPTSSPTDAPTKYPTDAPTQKPTGSPVTPPTTSPVLPGTCSDDMVTPCSTTLQCGCGSGGGTQEPQSAQLFDRQLRSLRKLQDPCVGKKNKECTGTCTWQNGICVTNAPPSPPPTDSPTSKPTSNPTKSPTTKPTRSPTQCTCMLTAFPTTAPVADPTNPPSKAPTSPPTESCTLDGAGCTQDIQCCSGNCHTGGGPWADKCKPA